MAISFRPTGHSVRPCRALLICGLVLSGSLAAPLIPHTAGSAEAQVDTKNWWWVTVAPATAQRMTGETLRLDELVRGGLVVASDGERPTEVGLVAAHLRNAKVVSSGLTQPIRTRPVRSPAGNRQIGETEKNLIMKQSLTVNDWRFDFTMPKGFVRGSSNGTTIPNIESVRRAEQPVFTWAIGGSEDRPALGGNRAGTEGLLDLGIYAGGAWIEESLARSGAADKVNWDRYETLYLLVVPTDPQERQQARVEALLIPFIPER